MFNGIKIDLKCAKELESAVISKKLSHAVILEGADAETRLLAAKELAKALLCKSETKPCNVCSSCIKVNADSHPDIHVYEKEADSTSIKVDEIRLIRKQAALLPNDADKCVFIISEAQDMGIAAQNALLKIFEEPASHVSFILTCNSKSSFLETIISRGSVYCLAANSDGAQANEKGALAYEKAKEMLEVLCNKTEYDFLCLTAQFQKDKELFSLTLQKMIMIFADALTLSQGALCCVCDCEDLARKISMHFTSQKIINYINNLRILSEQSKASANHNLCITRLCSIFYDIKMK